MATTPVPQPSEAVDISHGLQPSDIPAAAPPQTQPAPQAPPANYSVDDLPQFIKDNVDTSQIKFKPADPNDPGMNAKGVAYVMPDDPSTLHVTDPSRMDQQTLDHEATHMYQNSLKDVKFADVPKSGNIYDYGDEDGLTKAQQQGKKVTDFNPEQVAKMVETYGAKKRYFMDQAKQDNLLPEDVDAFKKTQAAYAPYIQQLAALGKNKAYAKGKEAPGAVNDLPELSGGSVTLKRNALPQQDVSLSAGLQPK